MDVGCIVLGWAPHSKKSNVDVAIRRTPGEMASRLVAKMFCSVSYAPHV